MSENPSPTDAQPVTPELSDALGEELYGATPGQIEGLKSALASGDADQCLAISHGLHGADLADMVEDLSSLERHRLIDLIGSELEPEFLTFLEDPVRDDVVGSMETATVAAAITELETDDALDVVESLDKPEQDAVLERLKAGDRAFLEEALSWPEDSAGRLMQREFVSMPSFWTVGDAIDFLRDEADRGGGALPDEFFDLYVVDPAHHPVGSIPLGRLLRNRRPVPLEQLMGEAPHTVPVETDQEEVSLLFRQYGLASVPVVDEGRRLVGVITHDDILEVVHEEAEEDIMHLGGVREDDLYLAALKTSRSRISWLIFSMISTMMASVVIWQFEATIKEIVALAILLPVVAALGGNAGTQAMTVAVRALAMKELHGGNAMRIMGKEIIVGAFNGIILASMVGVVVSVWFGSSALGLVIGGALVVNLLIAGLMGVFIPLVLDRAGADPALSSGVFLITVTDVVGFSAFLGFAALFLVK